METKDGIDYTFKPAILQDFMSAINTMKTKVRSAMNAFKDTGTIQEAQKALNKFGQAFNKIGDALANSMLLETIANIFGQIVSTASYFAGEIASQFSSLIDINGITNTCNQVKQVFSDMAGALKGAWEKFRDTGAIQACASALSAVKDAVLHVVDACAQSGVIESLANAFGKVVKKVAEAIEKIAEFVSSLDPGTIQAAFKAVTGLFLAFKGYKAIQNGVSHLKSFGSAAKNAGANAKDAVSNVKNLISAIKESASTKSLDPLKNLFKKKKDDSDESGGSVPNTGGIDKIKAKYEGIAKVVESVGNTIKTSIEGIGTAISGILDSITQGISLVIETLGTAISGIVTSLGGAISTAAQGIGTGIATIFRGLGEALAMIPPTTWLGIAAAALAVGAAFALAGSQGEGLQMILNGVATAVTALGPVIQTVFEGICSTIESFGSIIAAVFNGISGVITAFGEAVSGVLQSVSGVIDSIGTAALNAGKGFKELAKGIQIITGLNLLDMGASLAAVAAGIGAISAASVGIGNAGTQMMALVTAISMVGTTFASTSATVTASLNSIISAMSAAEARASTSGTAMGTKFTSGLKGGLSKGVSVARSSCNNIISAFNACQSRAQYCGQMIGQGLANGLRASEGSVRAAAASLAAAADAAIQAKAKIGSPSKVQYKNGIWWAQGLVNGMKAMKTKVKEIASDILYMPNMLQPNLSYSGMTTSLNSDYTYSMSGEYIIEVPLEIDGREMARATAKYDQAELARSQKFNKTLRGVK